MALSEAWVKAGEGGIALAEEIIRLCDEESDFQFCYELGLSIENKIHEIATKIYRAANINILPAAKK